MIITLLMILIGVTSLVAMTFVLMAIAGMSPHTRMPIRAAFVAKAGGFFIVGCAALDHFIGAPYTWPWLMLAGVSISNAGTAVLHLFNRRHCLSPECPVRRIVVLTDRPHE